MEKAQSSKLTFSKNKLGKSKQSVAENGLANKSNRADFLIVGIGASAGGVQALKIFFENVPANSGIAYVVILHLSPDHDSLLAEVLQTVSAIPVTQVKERVTVKPNHVYVVPPNEHLMMLDGSLDVSPNTRVEERRAPVDIFFRTLAESHQARAVCVVLSGTGANGSMGLKRVKERGGAAFVQNPREAEYSDMPRHAIATNLIDAVLKVEEIPQKIIAYKESFGTIEIPLEPKERADEQQHALREIFTLLRIRTGHDFSNYKRASVLRRIERRIQVHNLSDLAAYVAFFKEEPKEAHSLLKDLLISVTNFFRDRKAFGFLETDILPRILEGKTSGDQVRVWVAGCATGEEAYSIAMLLAEKIDGTIDAPAMQIFATDIDEMAITAARDGFYTLNDAADVSPKRLRRFFIKEGEGYRVRREIREMVLFAHHNVLKDPPFSHLDLATCRNLLIYFNHQAQERVMETLHFALNPGCFLFVGTSESIDGAGDLYAPVSKEHHVFQSRRVGKRSHPMPDLPPSARFDLKTRDTFAQLSKEQENRALERISFADLHQQLLEQYAPPSIVVNEEYDIAHLSDRAGRYLQIAGGEFSNNLLKLIRPELRLELRTALYQAVQRKSNVETENIKIKVDDQSETISINVRPVLRSDDTARGFLLVLFKKAEATVEEAKTIYKSDEPIARQLEDELTQIKSQLRSSIEQYEVQTEELKASNEELQAMNEELRSTAEELETGKEELQSVNEELVTVNQELKIKIEELSESNNDFQNLMNSTDIGTIFLDRNLRIKLFTPNVRGIFNLIPADLGRSLTDITGQLDYENLIADVEKVLDTLQPFEREAQTADGRTFLTRITTYRTAEDRISGVVLTFLDITRRQRQERKIIESANYLEQQTRIFDTTLSAISDFTYTFDRDGRFLYANQPLLNLLNLKSVNEIIGKNFFDLPYPKELAAKLQSQIQQVFKTKKPLKDETAYTSPTGVSGFYEYILSPIFSPGDELHELVAGSTRDITERKLMEEALRESNERLRMAATVTGFGVHDYDLASNRIFWSPELKAMHGLSQDAQISFENSVKFIHPDDRERVKQAMQVALDPAGDGEYEQEFRITRADTDETHWLYNKSRTYFEGEEAKRVAVRNAGVVVDVTTLKETEAALRESEERSRLLLESVTDYAILTVTPDNIINSWNAGAEKVFGYTEKEILGQSGEILFTPEDRERKEPAKEVRTATKKGRAEDERWHERKDGSRFYASGVMTPLADGKGFAKICRDQTERIAAEKVLRDKDTLQKLVGAQESERKRIARDLHDHLGQQLTALRFKLESIKELCANNKLLSAKIDETQLLAQGIDSDVDFLAWELRPAALDDLGLIAALKNYVQEWSRHLGVPAEFHISAGLKRMRLAPEIEINLYRIAQEALNNIYKHAQAKRVNVLIEKRDDSVMLIIEDNGVGFLPESKVVRKKGIGLMGMRERAALVGGAIEIESAPGQGATVYARVPIRLNKDSHE